MAGRRRTGALASALDMATNLIGFQIEQQEARRRRAEEILLKLAVEEQLNEAKRARALSQLKGGALEGTNLLPDSFTDPTTGVRYAAPRVTDQAMQANRLATLQQKIAGLESQDTLAPLLAEQARQEKFPEARFGIFKPGPGVFGGFAERPNALQRLVGVQQRPAVGAIPRIDTSYLRNQLAQLTGGQPPTVSSITQEDLDDLVQGIQAGQIRTRQEAKDLITESGLDPTDPAFADLLNQLP